MKKGDNMGDMIEAWKDLEMIMERVAIKVSIGIGRNMAEAEQSLAVAKARKHEKRVYNIELYLGTPLVQEAHDAQHLGASNPAVRSYMRLEEKLGQQQDKAGLKDLQNLKYDPLTGLLNRMGYAVEVAKLKQEGRYHNRVIILIDGDNMKETNTRLGYRKTDQYLTMIGRALKRQVRQRDNTDKKARNVDILLNRKNDSGGDEFIIDLSCPYHHAEPIARRYVGAMYTAQVKLGSHKVDSLP
jgi:diguanylate cyclase (GGDEF)-like protein